MRRPVLFLFLPLLLAAQSAPPDDLSQLSGRVLNAVTGEPVRRVTILLTRSAAGPADRPLAYTTSSNGEGHYMMKDLEPGIYRLTADRTGFVHFIFGARHPTRPGTTITLSKRQSVTDLTIKLTPHAVIAGRIVDDDGEPVVNVPVLLQGFRYYNGRKELTVTGGGANTNDLGEYRIFGVAPGKYFLSASPANRAARVPSFALDRSAPSATELDHVTTYYPGTIDPGGAVQLDVPAGGQLRGIDLILAKTRVVQVKGRVTHGGPGFGNVSVTLVARHGGGFAGTPRGAAVDPSGAFTIRGVTAGSYTLTANIGDSSGLRQARVAVQVGSSNVDDLNIVIGPGISVAGRIRSDTDSPPVDPSGVSLTFQHRDASVPFGGTARTDREGAFEFKNASPDRYNLSVMNLPTGAYLKSARSGEVDLLSAGLDLTTGAGAPLEVVVSSRGATISGASPPGSAVVLIPQEKIRRDQPYFYRNSIADQNGAYSLTGIPPGEYKLYAWEDVDPGAWMDPDFLKPVEDKGETVTVREGEQKTVPLKVIPPRD
jgi:protocatechuate 3,4-dioxygenase beta subunit